jgi:hypothetical protein
LVESSNNLATFCKLYVGEEILEDKTEINLQHYKSDLVYSLFIITNVSVHVDEGQIVILKETRVFIYEYQTSFTDGGTKYKGEKLISHIAVTYEITHALFNTSSVTQNHPLHHLSNIQSNTQKRIPHTTSRALRYEVNQSSAIYM